jgi:hypothetical protein
MNNEELGVIVQAAQARRNHDRQENGDMDQATQNQSTLPPNSSPHTQQTQSVAMPQHFSNSPINVDQEHQLFEQNARSNNTYQFSPNAMVSVTCCPTYRANFAYLSCFVFVKQNEIRAPDPQFLERLFDYDPANDNFDGPPLNLDPDYQPLQSEHPSSSFALSPQVRIYFP